MNKSKYHSDPKTRAYYIEKAKRWNKAHPDKVKAAVERFRNKKKLEYEASR